MMNRAFAMALVSALLFPTPTLPQQTDAETRLANGIRELEEGSLDAALVTLDGAVQRLKGDPARRKDLARAHLYLAVARLGLRQADSARLQMREALVADPDLALDPKQFPPGCSSSSRRCGRSWRQAPPARRHPHPCRQHPRAPARLLRRRRRGAARPSSVGGGLAVAGGLAAVAAGGGGGGAATPTPTPNPGGTVTLTLNVSPDSVGACGSGIAIHLVATNTTGASVTINSGTYEQCVVSGPCDLVPTGARSTTAAAVNADFSTRTIPPSANPVEIMNYGRSGSCGAPTSSCIRTPAQCRVQMDVVLNTSAGTFAERTATTPAFPGRCRERVWPGVPDRAVRLRAVRCP